MKTAKGYESGGSTARLQEQFGYAYDAAWNLQRRTNYALVQTFGVNAKNELTNATRSGTLTVAGLASVPGAGLSSVAVSGTGLSSGNANVYADGSWARAGATLADGNNSYTATATESSSYPYHGRTAQDSVTVNLPVTVTFQYDGNGNLTNDGRRVFEYDYENQLTNVYVASAWKSVFQYDAFGRRRVRKEYGWSGSAWTLTNEVRYLYDGMLVIQERDGNNLALVSYTRGNDLSGSRQGAGGIGGLLARTDHALLIAPGALPYAHAYYHADGNGNVTALVDTNGFVVARYQYDPYGNLLGMAGPLAEANPYRFSSKEWHANAGLYYYGFRYYEPNLQRWLCQDPIGEQGGMNLYAFCDSDPVHRVDPWGLSEEPCDWHHNYPRSIFTDDFKAEHGLKINIHDKNNGRMLPRDTHKLIRDDWNDDWKDWISKQEDQKKKITDKSVKRQLEKMLKDPRYKAVNSTGYRPKFDWNDTRRFRGMGLLAALLALMSETANAEFADDYARFARAKSDGNQQWMDLYAATLADHVRSCGMPDSFANRIATDLPEPD